MNKVRSTVKHMPRKAKLLTALLACMLVLTLVGVGMAETVPPEYILPFQSAVDGKEAIEQNNVSVANGALELSRPTEENCPPFNGKKQENGEWKNESWAWDRNKHELTGIVAPIRMTRLSFDENAGILRIKNTSEKTQKVTISYSLNFYERGSVNKTTGLLKIGNEEPITSNSGGTYSVQILANESVDILVKTNAQSKWTAVQTEDTHPKATLTLSNIKAEEVTAGQESLTLQAPGTGGNYTYKKGNGEATVVNGETKVNYSITDNETVTLTAQPKEGYKFYLWEDSDGKILSTNTEFIVSGTNGANPKSVRPVFVSKDTVAYYHIPDGILKGDYYYWQDAMSAARTNSNTNVVLLENLELNSSMAYSRREEITNNTLTIPSGVTLVVPYNNKLSTGKEDAVNTSDQTAAAQYGVVKGNNDTGGAFRTLTVSKNYTLDVNGTLLVNAVQGALNGATYNSHVVGNYGHMEVAGTVNVNAGGTLYARGYVTGAGDVNVLDNGTLYQMLQLVDWRGGNYSLPVASGNNYPTLPFSGYYLQNNMVHTTYHYGASMKARAVIAAMLQGKYVASGADVPAIANGDASNPSLFVMAEGASIETVYDKDKDQLKVTLKGDTSMNCLQLNVGVYSLTTEGKELAISDNIQVAVSSGKMTIAGGLKFLPGAKLTVANGAELEIAENGKAFFYAKDDYKDEYTYNAWRNKLQAADVIESTTAKVVPTEDADLDLNGSLVINGTLALSKSHPGLTANNGASVTVNYEPVKSNLLLYEPYKELKSNTEEVPAAPVLGDDVEARLVASDKGEADYVFENRGWTAPKGAMVDDGSTATLEKGTTYKAHDSKWYSHKITVNYSDTNVPATEVYTAKNECTFTAPEGYVITGIDAGETGITAANAVATDITPNSEGWRSVKLSNITAQEATLTATVKPYGRTVTWECKTGDKIEQSYSYLPANATEATLTFNGIVQINKNEVKVNGNAPAANQITISEANGKTSVKVTGISADTTVTVPYSASFTVTWKVKTDKGQVVTTTSQTEMNSATYALHNSDPAQKFWNVVEDAAIKLPTSSAAKVQARSNTDDIILTNVFGDTTVEIDITTYKHKVTTSTTVYKAADVKKDLAETIVTFVKEDTYKPALTKIKAADKYVVSKYEITSGTLGSKQNADVCAILPKDVSIDLSGKDVVVSLELQSYLYVWNWDATLDGKKMETNSGFTYTEYLTDRPTGGEPARPNDYTETPYYLTLRDYGEAGKYYHHFDKFAYEGYFGIDYRSMGNNRFAISGTQDGLPDYTGEVGEASLADGVLTETSWAGEITLKDEQVIVALVSYATKVTVKDGTNNGLPEGIFYADAEGKDVTSGAEIVYGAFDYNSEWDDYAKYLFVKGYTIGIDGAANPTTVDNVGALLGKRIYNNSLDGLTISAETVKSAVGDSNADLTVTLTDLAKYHQVYAVSEDGTNNFSYLMFVQSADKDGPSQIYAPKAEKFNVSCTRQTDKDGNVKYYPTLTVKDNTNYFFKDRQYSSADLGVDGKSLCGSSGAEPDQTQPQLIFVLSPYTASLTWNVGSASGTTYVTEDGKAYCGVDGEKRKMLEDSRYSNGTWTYSGYTVPDGKTLAPNALQTNLCSASYDETTKNITVSNLNLNSTLTVVPSSAVTDADTYYMGDMSFEYVRNAAAFTWDGKEGTTGSWKPVNSFGWRHAVGSKSYEVDGKTLTVDNGSILFVNNTDNVVTYNVWLSRPSTETYGVSLDFDDPGEAVTVNNGTAAVTVKPGEQVTLVCRMTGTPDFSSGKEIEIGTITVTKN